MPPRAKAGRQVDAVNQGQANHRVNTKPEVLEAVSGFVHGRSGPMTPMGGRMGRAGGASGNPLAQHHRSLPDRIRFRRGLGNGLPAERLRRC